MKNKLIKKHELGSEVKSKQIKDSLKNQNIRPVRSIVTKPRNNKKNIGVPKITGL